MRMPTVHPQSRQIFFLSFSHIDESFTLIKISRYFPGTTLLPTQIIFQVFVVVVVLLIRKP